MIVLHFASILLGVAFAAVAGAAQADIKTQWVEYTYGGAQLKGYLAYDDAITLSLNQEAASWVSDGRVPVMMRRYGALWSQSFVLGRLTHSPPT